MKNLIILITLGFSFLASPAIAQNERLKLSEPEDIAIAFYRTAGIVPDFKVWVWDRAPYIYTPAAKRKRMFDTELFRVEQAFLSFNKRRDSLNLRIPVDIEPQEKGGDYSLGLKIKGLEQSNYVSYLFLDKQFAIFPNDMDRVMDSKIDFALFDKLSTLRKRGKSPYVLLVTEVKEADAKRPYNIDGAQRWVLKTDIQLMTLYDGNGRVLWEYSAPINLSP